MPAKQRVPSVAVGLLLGLASGVAVAHSTVPGEQGAATQHLVRDANLILVGEVAALEYRLSEPDRAKVQVPQTLVTFKVIMPPMRGKYSSEQLILRFPGGSDGMGRFVEVEGSPRFQVGDRDVLFIRGNGEKGGCALVECEWGRFRLLLDEALKQDRVYDALGRPLFRVTKAEVKSAGPVPAAFRTFSFPRPAYDALIKNPEVIALAEKLGKRLEDPAVRKEYEEAAPPLITVFDARPRALRVRDASDDGTAVPRDNRERKPVLLEVFLKTVAEIDGELPAPRESIASVDPKAPLLFETSRRSVPPVPIDEGKQTSSSLRRSAAASAVGVDDRMEREAVAAAGGPVIGKRPQP